MDASNQAAWWSPLEEYGGGGHPVCVAKRASDGAQELYVGSYGW